MVWRAGKATLHELQTVYSLEDVYAMIEMINVDSYNRRLAENEIKRRAKNKRQ